VIRFLLVFAAALLAAFAFFDFTPGDLTVTGELALALGALSLALVIGRE
jgi:hypothetical protein